MASSSVSQESLDMDDFDTSARRNRIRVHRGHSGRGGAPYARGLPERSGVLAGEQNEDNNTGGRDLNGDMGGDGIGGPAAGLGSGAGGASGLVLSGHSHHGVDHESPTRSAAARLKDKQRGRPNHMKGKLPKDKRKLREKRRSTGVVHCMPSTESTGDSLDDEDDDEVVVHDTKKNTMYNEGTTSSHHHQSHYEARSSTSYSHPRRNKSPSDLEADLEDNQDYDSTVSHSETNLSLIGRSESSEMPPAPLPPGRSSSLHHQYQSHHYHHHHHHHSPASGGKDAGSSSSSAPYLPEKGMAGGGGVGGFPSKYSPETSRALKFNAGASGGNTTNNGSSDADSSSRTNTPSTSSSSSVLSRWRDYPDTATSTALPSSPRSGIGGSNAQPSPDSPRRLGGSTASATASGSLPASTISSSGSSSSIGGGTSAPSRPLGFSVFRDSNNYSTNNSSGGGGNISAPPSNTGSKPSYSSGSYLSGSSSRLRDRETGSGGSSSIHARMANYQSPRPYGSPSSSLHGLTHSSTSSVAQQQQVNTEELSRLEKELEKEREQNKRLQQQLEEKDKKIAELEKAFELLNQECDGLDEDNIKLQEENKALIRAMAKLSSPSM